MVRSATCVFVVNVRVYLVFLVRIENFFFIGNRTATADGLVHA